MKKLIFVFFIVLLAAQSLTVNSKCDNSSKSGTCIKIAIMGTLDESCGNSDPKVAKDCKK